jgi:transcriptional regulator with XRE-family HTH domain
MTISRIESGQKKRLELETAARLARVFEISLDQLCGLDAMPAALPSLPNALPCPACESDLVSQSWSAQELAAQIVAWREQEGMSLQAIVRRLNAARVPTRSGRGQWYLASLSKLLRQYIPRGKTARQAFLSQYGPERHAADDATAPPPTRKRSRKAAQRSVL